MVFQLIVKNVLLSIKNVSYQKTNYCFGVLYLVFCKFGVLVFASFIEWAVFAGVFSGSGEEVGFGIQYFAD